MGGETDVKGLPFPVGSKDYKDALVEGNLGWAIALIMCLVNILYYGQQTYLRFNYARYHSWGYGAATWMTVANLIRTFANFIIYSVMSLFVFMAAFDMPVMYVILNGSGWVGGILYALRTWVVLLFLFIGLWADDQDYYDYI